MDKKYNLNHSKYLLLKKRGRFELGVKIPSAPKGYPKFSILENGVGIFFACDDEQAANRKFNSL